MYNERRYEDADGVLHFVSFCGGCGFLSKKGLCKRLGRAPVVSGSETIDAECPLNRRRGWLPWRDRASTTWASPPWITCPSA